MKRSAINGYLRDAVAFFASCKISLPPFAYYPPEKWAKLGEKADQIRGLMLGWDVTDFGSGDFDKTGLLLFTLRNGVPGGKKPYAEKLLLCGEGQVTPMHFHFYKMEDIINRGGGNLLVTLYRSASDGGLSEEPVHVSVDGIEKKLPAGSVVRLTPGESITLEPGMYHQFEAERGFGRTVLGEVSMVNDDRGDNRFLHPAGRFAAIQEDEAPLYLLCNEYPKGV